MKRISVSYEYYLEKLQFEPKLRFDVSDTRFIMISSIGFGLIFELVWSLVTSDFLKSSLSWH